MAGTCQEYSFSFYQLWIVKNGMNEAKLEQFVFKLCGLPINKNKWHILILFDPK